MKTVIGLFDEFAQAKKAALDLENAGIPHEAISLVANNQTGQFAKTTETTTTEETTYDAGSETAMGAVAGGVAGLLIGLSPLLIPGFGAIAAVGWLTMTLAGAGVGAAVGLAGSLIHAGVPHEEATYYSEGVKRGGTLLAVKAEDDWADRVSQILEADGAVNIDERAAQWKQEGFQPTASQQTDFLPTPQTPQPASVNTATVRRFEVEPSGTEHTPRMRHFDTYEPDFQNNFQANYADRGLTYEQFAPAYQYGCDLANNPQYKGRDWATAESDIRRDWEARQPGTWDTFKDAIRYSWDKATGAEKGDIRTGGYDLDGAPDTRGIMEKTADAVTGDRIDDKTGKPVS